MWHLLTFTTLLSVPHSSIKIESQTLLVLTQNEFTQTLSSDFTHLKLATKSLHDFVGLVVTVEHQLVLLLFFVRAVDVDVQLHNLLITVVRGSYQSCTTLRFTCLQHPHHLLFEVTRSGKVRIPTS